MLFRSNIDKSFGEKKVLKGVSFTAEGGKAFGLLGRNGAGKTTSIRILMNVFPANSGEVLIDGKPVATFALIEGHDPTYARIYDGEWQNDNPHYVIHRVASMAGVHGIMRAVLNHAFTLTDTIRIDTHNDNVTMRTLLAKYGFSYCGIILLENGDPRLAFQKTL